MTNQSMYPFLRWHDAEASMTWMEQALGFTRASVTEGDAGRPVVHAELRLGDSLVMGSSLPREPDPYGGPGFGVYVAVDDPDAMHDRAVAAGAEIVAPLTDQPYGSRDFSVRDPEGNVWNFGTYRPG